MEVKLLECCLAWYASHWNMINWLDHEQVYKNSFVYSQKNGKYFQTFDVFNYTLHSVCSFKFQFWVLWFTSQVKQNKHKKNQRKISYCGINQPRYRQSKHCCCWVQNIVFIMGIPYRRIRKLVREIFRKVNSIESDACTMYSITLIVIAIVAILLLMVKTKQENLFWPRRKYNFLVNSVLFLRWSLSVIVVEAVDTKVQLLHHFHLWRN